MKSKESIHGIIFSFIDILKYLKVLYNM